jgi:hypothetical protein
VFFFSYTNVFVLVIEMFKTSAQRKKAFSLLELLCVSIKVLGFPMKIFVLMLLVIFAILATENEAQYVNAYYPPFNLYAKPPSNKFAGGRTSSGNTFSRATPFDGLGE